MAPTIMPEASILFQATKNILLLRTGSTLRNLLIKVPHSKISPASFAKIRLQSLRKSKRTGSMSLIIVSVSFTMQRTFVSTGFSAGRPMPAKRSNCAVSDALPALRATKPALISNGSIAASLHGLPMSVTGVQKKVYSAPLNCVSVITPGSRTGLTESCGRNQDPGSISQSLTFGRSLLLMHELVLS